MYRSIRLFAAALLLAGCAVDPLEDMSPSSPPDYSTENPERVHAWLWAYSSTDDSIHVLHTVDKQRWESLALRMDRSMGFATAGLIGGGIYPTIWAADGGRITAFTNGILDHGDHGHIVRPKNHVRIALQPDLAVVYRSVAPDRDNVVFAALAPMGADTVGRIVTVRTSDGDTAMIGDGEPATVVVSAGDRILAAGGGRAGRIIRVADNSLLATVALDTPVTCGVYHASSRTAFIACRTGIDIVDMESCAHAGAIPYPGPERVSVLRARGDADVALGLCAADGTAGDCVLALDLAARTLTRVGIDGAALAGDMTEGTVALSDDGTTTVLCDLAAPKFYRVDLRDAAVERTDTPAAACPVACDWDGSRVWALAGTTAYQVSFARDEIVDSIAVPARTDWIMVTSFSDNSALFDSNDHTF
ncbi:MAG: hypothetical protein GF331_22570 [Chitinivibrionales bacterium]|nr:hypothetical protein [Chitinivibrionales bacterium]